VNDGEEAFSLSEIGSSFFSGVETCTVGMPKFQNRGLIVYVKGGKMYSKAHKRRYPIALYRLW
jgi:hypothetical protein